MHLKSIKNRKLFPCFWWTRFKGLLHFC